MSGRGILVRKAMFAAMLAAMATPASAQEACFYDSKAYNKNFTGCFRNVALECAGFNDWRLIGSCANSDVPGGTPTPGLPDVVPGPLCEAAGFDSPNAEGCIGGFYQRCLDDTTWNTNVTVVEGAACK